MEASSGGYRGYRSRRHIYPFRETVARPGLKLVDAVENIDIGGPAMVRSAAKNYEHVAVVTDPATMQPYWRS